MLYEMALYSGLRLGELRHLKGAHLDIERVGVRLEAEWTKNRRAGFQPLPRHLVAKLARATEYPSRPLLRVPSQPQLTRLFDRDLKGGRNRQGKRGRGGRLSFLARDVRNPAGFPWSKPQGDPGTHAPRHPRC